MLRFVFYTLSLFFGFCSLVVGTEKLFVTLEEQENITRRVVDLHTANWGAIHTWQGRAIVTKKTFEAGKEDADPTTEMKYEVDFACDVLSGNEAWDSRFLAGKSAHARENVFVRDGIHHYLITHSKEGDGGLRQLNIFPGLQPLVVHFNPFDKSFPTSMGTIRARLSMTILESHLAIRIASKGFSEDANEKFQQDVLANGFKDYRLKLDGNILTRESRSSGLL